MEERFWRQYREYVSRNKQRLFEFRETNYRILDYIVNNHHPNNKQQVHLITLSCEGKVGRILPCYVRCGWGWSLPFFTNHGPFSPIFQKGLCEFPQSRVFGNVTFIFMIPLFIRDRCSIVTISYDFNVTSPNLYKVYIRWIGNPRNRNAAKRGTPTCNVNSWS